MSNPSIAADKTPWYQWDTGLTVTVSGGEMNECHFANRKQGTAYVQAVINGVARVPDELLQVAAPIKAYCYVSDGAGGQTYVEQNFEVIARNIPADYTYTKTTQKTIRDAEVARDQAVQAANDAKASELAADDSAIEASTSAQSAGESASAAATSASNAAKSAGDAATSADNAKAAADKAVEDASGLLKTYTDNAKTSADNAATSASNATDAASAASDSASAAAQSATDASNAKVAAQTAKAGAETAANNAATSASNAESSATAAAKSASDAAASVGAINVIAPKTVSEAAYAPSFEYGFAAARGSKAYGGGIAIGVNATSGNEEETVSYPVSIGAFSKVLHTRSVSIGAYSETSKPYEVSVGRSDITREITNISTPTTPTSAVTKKYTDDNDAKTLSEAKKYTDANTSNALVGTVSGKMLHVEDAWPGKPISLTIDGAYKQEGTPSPENPVPIVVVENPVLRVTGADTSAIGASIQITLPAEHPYLAALPDGTHDEIVIDKDGNASLVARVKAITLDDINEAHHYEEKANGADFQVYFGDKFKYGVGVAVSNVCVDGNVDQAEPVNGGVIKGGYVRMTKPEKVTGIGSAKEYLIEIGFAAYIATVTPVTYNLGKLEIPSLPETISNVWTDAELNTDMSMTYKRDINIAFDNLAQAVVAAAAGE